MDRVLHKWGAVAGVQGAVSVPLFTSIVFIGLFAYDIEDAAFQHY